jgi:hypothetical protein
MKSMIDRMTFPFAALACLLAARAETTTDSLSRAQDPVS